MSRLRRFIDKGPAVRMVETPANDTLSPGLVDRLFSWLFSGVSGPRLVAFCSLAAFVAVLSVGKIFDDGDTYWHLATGDWILLHGAIPTTDPFSYTFAGAPWQAHEWLSELLMALVFRAGGWSGLALLFAAAVGAAALIVAAYLRRWLAPGPLMLALGFALACGAPSLLARPHLLAFPVLAAWVVGLVVAREEGRAPSWRLLPLMLVWANLHGSFVLGLALIGPFALEALVENRHRLWATLRDWALFSFAALALALVTPHGIEGLIFPLKVTGMTSLPVIVEWRSADFSKLSVFEIALLEVLFLCLWRGVQVPVVRLLLLLGLLHMALQHIRHQAAFALIAAMLLAEPLARAKSRPAEALPHPAGDRRAAVLAAVVLGLAVIAVGAARLALPITRGDGVNSPISALAAVPPDLARRPVFNEYGFGGYLIFMGVRPFIDGRADMYGDTFMHLYSSLTRPDAAALRAELEARDVDWTILQPTNPAVAVLDELPGWRRLHADRIAVVHVRISPGASNFAPGAGGIAGPSPSSSPTTAPPTD
ncbi:hypothetical protein M9M90_16570 [Phenylobacterium sp. LH3H17]|uniref:hypothetical protein n=1 Tax=Phenylobacterium sp. LH3H17 TaxID=2903901 RepID=UPI0020C985C0|nr:hypothetical protein [Phenylobacterium sp. LH3H17]UTP38821.1 hypothetical protein M9M90_16570 [Phenylobacterium sp. LH3H17]